MRIRKSAARLLGSAYSASTSAAPAPGAPAPPELLLTTPPPPHLAACSPPPESSGWGGYSGHATASGEACELSRSPWDLIAELSLSDPQVSASAPRPLPLPSLPPLDFHSGSLCEAHATQARCAGQAPGLPPLAASPAPGSCMPLGLAGGAEWAPSGRLRPQMPAWPGSTSPLLPFPRGNLGAPPLLGLESPERRPGRTLDPRRPIPGL